MTSASSAATPHMSREVRPRGSWLRGAGEKGQWVCGGQRWHRRLTEVHTGAGAAVGSSRSGQRRNQGRPDGSTM